MSSSDQWQHAACVGQRSLGSRCACTELLPEISLPYLWRSVGVVEEPAPDPIGVLKLLPVLRPALELFVQVGTASAGYAGALAAFEREGFADLEAGRVAKVSRLSVTSRERRVAPKQVVLGSGPEAI